jgi:hypothetical protein
MVACVSALESRIVDQPVSGYGWRAPFCCEPRGRSPAIAPSIESFKLRHNVALKRPLASRFNSVPGHFGPFFFQSSRPLHYLVYFLVGAGVGACGFNGGLLASEGKLARRWILWCVAALIAFVAATAQLPSRVFQRRALRKCGE